LASSISFSLKARATSSATFFLLAFWFGLKFNQKKIRLSGGLKRGGMPDSPQG